MRVDRVNKELKKYMDENILPLYVDNIGGHGPDHINLVIERSFELIDIFHLDVDVDMVYVIAVYHDIGYKVDPKKHEEVSSQMFRNNKDMEKFFNEEEIDTIACAIVDHRGSLEYEARSIYGKIVSSADRAISVMQVLERSILYHMDKNKNASDMELIESSYKKMSTKYGRGGYAKMYFPDKKYLDFLDEIGDLVDSKEEFINVELEIIKNIRNTKKLVRK